MTEQPIPIHADAHDLGLLHDLETLRRLNRRRALGFLGLAGSVGLIAACGPDGSSGASSTGSGSSAAPTPSPSVSSSGTPTPTPSSSAACTAYARETNGPYPADGTNTSRGATSNVLPITTFQRSDIRSSLIGSSTVAQGVLLDLTLAFVDVNNACAPLAGYAIYLWHCDATGGYSLYDLPGESYLRGIQVTDANGEVRFRTVFPGCYAGRYPHIHFEAFTSLANATAGNFARLISQFAMPAAACTAVYGSSTVYGSSLARFNGTSIGSDNVFGDNTAAQQTAMTLVASGSVAAGYAATATIGVAT